MKEQLKEYRIRFKKWWSNLSLREQKAISFGSAALGIFIVYQFIWLALINSTNSLRQQIQSQQKMLVWMRATDKNIKQIEGQTHNKNTSVSPVTFLSFLQDRINHTGLALQLSQLKQASNDSVEMHFQKVEFDKLIQMLTATLKEQPVTISQLSVSAENAPGIVNADVVLKIG